MKRKAGKHSFKVGERAALAVDVYRKKVGAHVTVAGIGKWGGMSKVYFCFLGEDGYFGFFYPSELRPIVRKR